MERETIEVRIVGFGRKWEDFSAQDSYLYYFEDDYFCEKVYPDAFDSEILNLIDEDIEFSGIEEGCLIEYEFNIGVDKDLLNNAETAKDFLDCTSHKLIYLNYLIRMHQLVVLNVRLET